MLAVVAAAGCQKAGPSGPPAGTTAAGKPTPVTLTLNWFPEAEHGGFYAALVHGYYRDEGLDVTIQPGGPDVPVVQYVASGQVQFAVDNADKLFLVRAEEADVVALLAPIQDSPRCLVVHEDAGINTLQDLSGKKDLVVAMNPGQPFATFLQQKLDLKDATIVPYTGSVAPFLGEKNMAMQAYNFSEPFAIAKQGAKAKSLMVSDLGFNPYASLLLTSRKLLDEQPELAAKMVRASRKGWAQYLKDPAKTNAHIHEQNPEMTLEVLDFGVKTLRPMCLNTDVTEANVGSMSAERWQTLSDQLVEMGQLEKKNADPTAAYSTKFIE